MFESFKAMRDNIESYVEADNEYDRSVATIHMSESDSFVLSGVHGDNLLHARVTFLTSLLFNMKESGITTT